MYRTLLVWLSEMTGVCSYWIYIYYIPLFAEPHVASNVRYIAFQ